MPNENLGGVQIDPNTVGFGPWDRAGTPPPAANGPDLTPWANPYAGVYEGNGGDPREAGNAQGISDWKAMINKVYGPGDPVAIIQKIMSTGAPSNTFMGVERGGGINFQALSDMRRKLLASGMDPYTAAQLENAFGASGADAHDSAYRLGLFQQFKAGGQAGLRPQNVTQQSANAAIHRDAGPSANVNYTGAYDPNWNSFAAATAAPTTGANPVQPVPVTPYNTPPTNTSPFRGVGGPVGGSRATNPYSQVAPVDQTTPTTPSAPRIASPFRMAKRYSPTFGRDYRYVP